jgi:hypothetical protein
MTKSRQQKDEVASAFVSLNEAVEVVTIEVLSPLIAEQRLKVFMEQGHLASKAEDIVVWSKLDEEVRHLGAGWVPPQAWKNADVRWAESSFTGPWPDLSSDRYGVGLCLMIPPPYFWSDRYEYRGVRVSVDQLKKLFPLAYKYSHIPDNTVKRPRGRKPGSGFHKQDESIVEKMRELIMAGSCSSPTAAVRLIDKKELSGLPGNSPEAVAKRLERRYHKKYPDPRVKNIT